MQYITITFTIFFTLRLGSLFYSIRNEKRILKLGAKQYGKTNSLLLTLAHIAFYFSALYEAYYSEATFGTFSACGALLMAFAYSVLFYVIYRLRDVWTLKIYILPDHRIERSWLFRNVRHPNYYLSIIPELIGVALLCNAWYTLGIGLPIYLCLLYTRIRQEEAAMQSLL